MTIIEVSGDGSAGIGSAADAVRNDALRDRSPILLLYWGRRGALGRFTLELAKALHDEGTHEPILCVSSSGESFDALKATGIEMAPVDTFQSGLGALTRLWRIVGIRRRLGHVVEARRVRLALTLMSHVWSPLLGRLFRAKGARQAVIIHDAVPHPGDRTGVVHRLLMAHAMQADILVTLSPHVTRQLVETWRVPAARIVELFHPEFIYDIPARSEAGSPVGFLFFGRVMPYKGLHLFVEAVERLRARGVTFRAAVIGEGDVSAYADRIKAADIELVDRWIGEDEIPGILSRFDVMVACHTEASQSGVVALGLGGGLPAIVTPVGGLPEQIEPGRNGLLAASVDGAAVAAAMERIATDAALLETLRAGAARRGGRTFQAFARRVVELADQVEADDPPESRRA